MQRDIRDTSLYREAEARLLDIYCRGSDHISDAADVSTNGTEAVYSGVVVRDLNGTPPSRICLTQLVTGDTRILTQGPNTDRCPKYSPDGCNIAFLSDRHDVGSFQLYLLDPLNGAVRSTPAVEGWVEYLSWSPNGKRILLGVAGHGADTSVVQGGVPSRRIGEDGPDWIPTVESGDEAYRWRGVYVYQLESNSVHKVTTNHCNIWEAVWCGDDRLAAVVSPRPEEGAWYSARIHLVDAASGSSIEIYRPEDQVGRASASPSGKYVAVVDAICSDRGFVAGDLRLLNASSHEVRRPDTCRVCISYVEWLTETTLLLAGHRGLETVVGLYHLETTAFTELWCSESITTAGLYAAVSGLNDLGDCVVVAETFFHAPAIGVIRNGAYQPVRSFGRENIDSVESAFDARRVDWISHDGLECQGWVLSRRGRGPYPLLTWIHGGPIWHWRPRWLGRSNLAMLMLIERGYAIFLPNPRGSDGRGREFTRRVIGDLAGADAQDILSGIDHLVDQGIAEVSRLGVTGISYGGFMTSWLITQDPRFAAAVSVAPITNHVTEYLLSNIPHFLSLFLQDTYSNPTGKCFERSPIMHAHKVSTPTLNICGALDRCTPPAEAAQFHSALLQHHVESALVTYPGEGHGIRKWPAAIDCAARIVSWFEDHMGAES